MPDFEETVNIPPDTLRKIMDECERTGKSFDEITNEVVKKYNDEMEPIFDAVDNAWEQAKNDLFN